MRIHLHLDDVVDRLRYIGRVNRDERQVIQTAHVLKTHGKFYLCHHKSLKYLDGDIDRQDVKSQDLIDVAFVADILHGEGIITVLAPDCVLRGAASTNLRDTYSDRPEWRRISKYVFRRKP